MKAQSALIPSLPALLMAVLPVAAAEPYLVQLPHDFSSTATQAVIMEQRPLRLSSWEHVDGTHGMATAGGWRQDPLFTLGGIRFNAMGTASDGISMAVDGSAEAGLHVSLFHLLNAFSDQNPLMLDQDYVLRLNLPF